MQKMSIKSKQRKLLANVIEYIEQKTFEFFSSCNNLFIVSLSIDLIANDSEFKNSENLQIKKKSYLSKYNSQMRYCNIIYLVYEKKYFNIISSYWQLLRK